MGSRARRIYDAGGSDIVLFHVLRREVYVIDHPGLTGMCMFWTCCVVGDCVVGVGDGASRIVCVDAERLLLLRTR